MSYFIHLAKYTIAINYHKNETKCFADWCIAQGNEIGLLKTNTTLNQNCTDWLYWKKKEKGIIVIFKSVNNIVNFRKRYVLFPDNISKKARRNADWISNKGEIPSGPWVLFIGLWTRKDATIFSVKKPELFLLCCLFIFMGKNDCLSYF